MRTKIIIVVAAAVAVTLTPSVAAAAQGHTAPLLGSGGAGSYIVVLKSGTTAATDAVARRAGVTVQHRYSATVTGFSAQLTRAELAQVRRDPTVGYVEHDGPVRAPDATTAGTTGTGPGVLTSGSQSPVPSWGLDRIDTRPLSYDNTYHWLSTGWGVRAYVIDTGIRASHPDIYGRVLQGYDFVDNDTNADDCNGHGTSLAGIIGGKTHGVAKGVRMVPVRVLNCSGSGTYSGVIAGIDWVTRTHVKPATAILALGGGASTAMDDAVKRSLAAGVSYSVAAGASASSACNYSPARVPGALTVGASASNDYVASFTNTGPCLDLFAPGVSITTISYTGGTITLSGTSFATAHVTGAAALYLEFHPTATAQQVHDKINASATMGVLRNVPIGTPNRLLYSLLT
jgi:hypothetical protein